MDRPQRKPATPSVAAAAVLAALLRPDGASALSFGFDRHQPERARARVDTALPSAVAAPVETGAGIDTDEFDDRFDVGHTASTLLESSSSSFGRPLPQNNVAMAPNTNNNAASPFWPSSDDGWGAVGATNDQQKQPAQIPSGHLAKPIRIVITGRDRRAGRESFAALGFPARRGVSGGEIGSPGGAGDWRFTTGHGPSTASATPSNTVGATATSPPPTRSTSNSANSNGLARHGSVMTGSERRATFGGFDPFAPAHEAVRGGKAVVSAPRVPVKSDAMKVAETLDAIGGAPEETAVTSEVPTDTPARRSLPPHLSLRPIPGKGLGVITNRPIARGEFVGDYEGEIMTEEVKDRRYLSSLQDTLTDEDREWIQSRLERGQTLTGCYLYGVSLADENVYGRFNLNGEDSQKPKRIYVDAEDEQHSLWTRFLNHASPPNDNIIPKSVPESWNGRPRVWFVAKRDINAGEEICFDYGEDYWLEGDNVV